MKEFIYAAMASETIKKYGIIIRDMAESGKDISLKEICEKRDNYANMVLNEVGIKDTPREDAFEFAHKIIRGMDMLILENAVWKDDMD